MTDLIAKTAIDRRLAGLVGPTIEGLGYELVRIRLMGGKTRILQIMADRPEGGIEVEDCARISTLDALEEAGEVLIADAYRLEVSSPGIDRPLTRPKDYANWAGHEARINLTVPVEGNRKSLQGELVGLEGDVVTLEDKKSGRVSFPLSDIHSAKLVLTDRLIAATRPLDSSGADELLEEQED